MLAYPTVIPRSQHNVSRALISEAALQVLYRLRQAGYDAYLVGGGVRDILLERQPKDFDVATNARPEQVRQIFRNCRLVGRRFLLAHVHFGDEIVEVATFRANHDQNGKNAKGGVMEDGGRILRDNVYGTLEQDAWRRDFTVNALYYNIRDFAVLDFGNGMEDLRAGVLRLIGEPYSRYREDPVRMLRAIRFAAKLGFTISPETEEPIAELSHLLQDIPAARLFDETLKLFLAGKGRPTFELLRQYDLFGKLFPQTEKALKNNKNHAPLTLLTQALTNTDERVITKQMVTPSFLFAALLWEPMRQQTKNQEEMGAPLMEALHSAADYILQEQINRVAIPRRYTLQIRNIWSLQGRLTYIRGKRHLHLLENHHFRAAYDLLLLRAASGEDVQDLADYWTQIQTTPPITVAGQPLAAPTPPQTPEPPAAVLDVIHDDPQADRKRFKRSRYRIKRRRTIPK